MVRAKLGILGKKMGRITVIGRVKGSCRIENIVRFMCQGLGQVIENLSL